MITSEQKALVKATVPVLKENGAVLTDYFYKRMLKNNPSLKETFNMGNQRSGAQAKALAGAVLAYAENIDDPSVLAPVIELICNKHVSLNIQAPDYDIVGENLLYSISEVLAISMDDDLIDAWAAAYNQLAQLFISTERKIYEQHTKTSGSWLGWRDFTVSSKVHENSEITSFYLIPKDGGNLPDFRPGQYISVRVFIPELNLKQPRQYSLSDSSNGKYLRISVKKEEGNLPEQDPGYVSSTLHNGVNVGDNIEVSAPTGNFFLINSNHTNVFISAGIGITPMVAMLNQIIIENEAAKDDSTLWGKLKTTFSQKEFIPKRVVMIHAARNPEVHFMRNEIKHLEEKKSYFESFTAYENLGQESTIDADLIGRLDLNKVPSRFLPKNADYYLCGPIPFMQIQKDNLIQLGIAPDAIHLEAFGVGGF